MTKPTVAFTDGTITHAADLNTPLNYLLDSNNPNVQFRNGTAVITTNSSGIATFTFTPFPTASGYPVMTNGDYSGGSFTFSVVGSMTNNGTVGVFVVNSTGGIVVGTVRVNYFIAGN